jgi:enamine deaminase RidA (YjgF/YER057c/UK114 family)
MNTAEENFNALELSLPPVLKPIGVYKSFLVNKNYLYLSGHGPVQNDGTLITGRIGETLGNDEGKLASLQTGLSILSTIHDAIGSFNKIKRVIKLLGMVNCTADFKQHSLITDACSELFVKVWGEEHGAGVRSAIGVGSLPANIPIEIEVLFELVYF